MNFISYGQNPHIVALANHLDIEFCNNISLVKNSNKKLIMWNYFSNKELFDHFKQSNKQAYCVERGALPNTIFIDGGGFNFLSSSYHETNWNRKINQNEIDVVDNYIKHFCSGNDSLEPQLSMRLEKKDFLRKIGFRNSFKKIIFIPLQLNRDSVIKYFSDFDIPAFIKLITKVVDENQDFLFLIKNHPLEKNITEEKINLKIVDDLHFKDCIQYSDYILTINSGVGLQSMIFNKPVLICGNAFYNFSEINKKVNNIQDINSILRGGCFSPNIEKIKRFIHWLIEDFYSFVEMKKPDPLLNRMLITKIEKLRVYG